MKVDFLPSRFSIWLSLIVFGVLIVSLILATVAYATQITVNTNNGVVDATWLSMNQIYASDCPSGALDPRDQLRNGWVGNDNGYFYFRIETCSGAALSSQSVYAVGLVDCNDDGDATDPSGGSSTAGDRIVNYMLAGGSDNVEVTDPSGASLFPLDSTYGERVGGGAVNIEWKTPSTSQAIYPDCRGNAHPIRLGVGTMDSTTNTMIDQSTLVRWNTPTEVRVRSFRAVTNPNNYWMIKLIEIILILGGVGLLRMNFRQKKQ